MPKRKSRFLYWQSPVNERWYYRLEGANFEPVAPSEGYNSQEAVLKAIDRLPRLAAEALDNVKFLDRTPKSVKGEG